MADLTRRRFLTAAGSGAVLAGVGACVPFLTTPGGIGRLVRSELPLPEPFTVPLRIPEVLTPRSEGSADIYDIVQRESPQQILPGIRTPVWGYNGTFPGPTIVSRSGRRTIVRHHNELPVPTVTHLHGGHTPSTSDGYPTDLLLPRGDGRSGSGLGMPTMTHDPEAVVATGTRVHEYPLNQRAATLWYHDHRMDYTGASVWRGLAGFHLIHDEEEDALPLPRGDRDIPLMIVDRAFSADGTLRYPSLDPTLRNRPGVLSEYMQGVLGDVVLVNGVPWPMQDVGTARYRFRILNASNARQYRLTLHPPPPGGGGFVQVGSDGGLLDAPVTHDELDIAPGERFDVVIDFARYRMGERITLRNALSSGGTGQVMRFHVARRQRDDSRVPETLARLETLREDDARTIRDFSFRAANSEYPSMINGKPFDPSRVDAAPTLGSTEIWRFTTDFHHPIHLHLVGFQVLSRNGDDPGPYDKGWKDTLDLDASGEAAILVRFTGYTGRYVFHCHNLEHEDMAMMANFRL
jgi:spore coat protein A